MSQAYIDEGSSLKSEIQDKAVEISTKLSGEFFSKQSMTKEQFAEALGQARQDSLRATSEIANNYAEKARIEGDLRKSSFYTNMANAYSDLASNYQAESASEYLARTDSLVAKGLGELTGVAGDLYTSVEAYDKYLEGDIDGASAVLVGMLAGTAAWAFAVTLASGPIGIGIALIASVVVGDMFKEIFPGWESVFDYWLGNDISSDVNIDFLSALNFVQRYDPLALDLDGDGIETVSANAGITFDFDGDGLKTGTGWVKGDDGLLVLDRNGNGAIDNGGELFGVDTVKSNGQKAANGFDALRDLDSNGDGAFDAQDTQYDNVRVWQDTNQDGVAQASELKTLAELDITAINLDSTASNQASNGNRISAVGSFVRSDGSEGTVNGNQSLAANLDLASNPFYREYTDEIPLDKESRTLPDMRGSGAVRDLREAAAQDANLRVTLASYAQAETREQQMAMLDGLLAAWADSSSYDTLFERINDMKLGRIDVKFSYSWELPTAEYAASGGGGSSAGGGLALGEEWSLGPAGPTEAQLEKKALLEKIKLLEVFNGQNFFNFSSEEKRSGSDGISHELKLASGTNTTRKRPSGSLGEIPTLIYVTEGDLVINAGQAALLNEAYAQLKESVYEGLLLQTRLKPYIDAIGLTVSEGGLSYDFDGLVGLIEEAANPVTSMIELLELKTSTVGDIVPAVEFSGMLHTLQARLSPEEIAQVVATFGSKGTNRADLLVGTGLNGGSGDDLLIAMSADGGTLNGDAGNDQLYGGTGNDTLDGGSGSNRLYGGAGDDVLKVSGNAHDNILAGGTGNDTLHGSYYSDTYLFNLGDGVDTIHETTAGYSHTDVLRFGEGIQQADIQFQRVGTDLVFAHVNGADKIILKNVFNGTSATAGVYSSSLIERLEFADGSSLTWSQITQQGLVQHGSAGGDQMIGYSGIDEMHGGAGNDTLDGGSGSNRLYGGAGDDALKVSGNAHDNILAGGTGNDTLHGSYYSDTYLFNLGDGVDTIHETTAGYSNTDVLRFGEGIQQADIQFQRVGTDLVFAHVNGADKIILKNVFNGTSATAGVYSSSLIERLEFADGSSLTWSQITQQGLVQHGSAGGDQMIGYSGIDEMHGGAGNDTLDGGSGSNRLYGGAGDDVLKVSGNAHDNILAGGTGNDTLHGSYYSDTYLFNLGDGVDTIHETTAGYSNTDVLRFGEGIQQADIQFQRVGTDLVFAHVNGADKIILKNVFNGTSATAGVYSSSLIERLEFADGSSLTWSQITQQGLVQHGSAGGDQMIGYSGIDEMHGGAGNDTLDGGSGSNRLYGGAGDDALKVSGNAHDNILAGGTGNDTLHGSYYSDTYLFNLGDGVDTIHETTAGYSNTDVLRFGEGIQQADIQFQRVGTDLVFAHVNGADKIILKNVFNGTSATAGVYSSSLIERLEFADGSSLTWSQITQQGLVQHGSAGGDQMIGYSGIDEMHGGAGNDTLDGGSGSNRLYGGAGDDVLKVSGNAHDNILAGGTGNDTLHGSYYSDTYLFNLGDGVDTIHETTAGYSHTDVLRFGEGIQQADIQFQRVGTDLVFAHVNGADKIILKNVFNGTSATAGVYSSSLIERLEFADGSSLTWSQITQQGLVQHGSAGGDQMIGYSGIDEMHGGAGNDTLDGGSGSNRLYGGAGDDVLKVSGNAHDNILAGGTGNDTLHGSYYSDTYLFNLGDGVDTIHETTAGYSNTDVLRFGEGIQQADIQFQRVGTDLVFAHVNGADKIILKNVFNGTSATAGVYSSSLIERLEFADGSSLTWSQITQQGLVQHGSAGGDQMIGYSGIDEMHGGAGNDTLDGGSGSNRLYGGAGDDVLKVSGNAHDNILAGGTGNDTLHGSYYSDTYLFNLGDGVDTIHETTAGYSNTDVLRFGEGIQQADIQFQRVGTDLVFAHVNGADKIILKNVFNGTSATAGVYSSSLIERLEFADGSSLTWSQITQQGLVQHGSAGGDQMIGYSGIDEMHGGAGNDTLDGGSGSNRLYGGAGDDVLKVSGNAHDNILAGGTGNDTLHGSYYSDTYLFNLGDGVDTIHETTAGYSHTDVLQFGADISPEQLWFQRSGNNLDILVEGGEDRVTISDWYSGSAYKLEKIQTLNGLALSQNQVQNLVDAMAAFGAPASGESVLTSDQRAQLDLVIATAWQ